MSNHKSTWYDPTTMPEHRYPTPNRRLRRFAHIQDRRNRTIALTPVATYIPVSLHRNRAPRFDIGNVLLRAESLGLNVIAIRDEYRRRADNYGRGERTISIETNSTFRGA